MKNNRVLIWLIVLVSIGSFLPPLFTTPAKAVTYLTEGYRLVWSAPPLWEEAEIIILPESTAFIPPESVTGFLDVLPSHTGSYSGELFSVTGDSARQFLGTTKDDDGLTLSAGNYELDIYKNKPVFQVRRETVLEKFAALLMPRAYAGEVFDDEYYIGTIRFTITDEPEPACCSSVLFLPGLMASRLYEGGEKRWEPTGDTDIEELYLDEQGKSLNEITATEILEKFDGPLFLNKDIYKSFLIDLDSLKQSNTIADYQAVSYDWRLSLSDILADGSIEQTLRSLASESKSGKVTIVSHSNGGLLAKALMNELGPDAADLVDQMIFVGVPQLGTPQAVGALLHGYDTGLPTNLIPFLLSPERARDFAKNMPGVYQLLPQPDYYENDGVSIYSPIISFESGAATEALINEYGTTIDTGEELHNFLVGAEGRTAPLFNDLKNPGVANSTLLENTKLLAEAVGSSWEPPEGVAVHEIAGIGEPTLSGITYKTVQKCTQVIPIPLSVFPGCAQYEPTLSYVPNETIDGDDTVVVPSALLMEESGQINRWWVDLAEHNQFFNFKKNRDHADLLEIDNLRSFILENLITNSSTIPPEFIANEKPIISKGKHLSFILHSPLSLSAVDKNGNRTGEEFDDIPGASYKRYGEVQVLHVPADVEPTINLNGISDGSFTLEIKELDNEEIVAVTTFSGIPSVADTKATISFADGTIENAGDLTIDYNGDGSTDIALSPEPGEVVTLPEASLDATAPEARIEFSTTLNKIAITGFDESSETTDATAKNKTTITDAAGNSLALTHAIKGSKATAIAEIKQLAYNTADTIFAPKTVVRYHFLKLPRLGRYAAFVAHIRTPHENLLALYHPAKDKTMLITIPKQQAEPDLTSIALLQKPPKGSAVKQTLNGLVIPFVETKQGKMIIKY